MSTNTPVHSEEHEVKYESQANLQLKYSIIEKPEEFQRKFECLLGLLGLSTSEIKTYRLEDHYYDDEQFTIERAGFSLRVRRGETENTPYVMTVKSSDRSPKGSTTGGLRRIETEIVCSEEERTRLLDDPEYFASRFAGIPAIPKSKVHKILSVVNDRLAIGFSTNLTHWRMCYDRFYFFYALDGQYSPFFSEAELERMGDASVEDPQIVALQRALVDLFGLSAHKQAKLKRGRSFLIGEYPPVANICAIGFDIVGYSKMAPQQQLQSIQNLNKFTKDAVREMVGDDFQCIYIPTGDGMCLVIEGQEWVALPLIERVQNLTKKFNKASPLARFTFRTGVHHGPVFRYSDVNENLNYAGNGIGLAARMLGVGTDWHVLVSKEARAVLLAQGAAEQLFQDIGIVHGKDGVPIHVYNVFEHGKFGNPSSPR